MYNMMQYGMPRYGSNPSARPADYGFHNSQIGANVSNPYAQGLPPVEERSTQAMPQQEEESELAKILGAIGLGKGGPSQQQIQPINMSQYASVNSILGTLNGITSRGGQEPYQNFMDGFKNPYIQQLLRRG